MKLNITTIQKSSFTALFLLLAPFALSGAAPDGYYDSLEGKTGVELKKAIKTIVRSHHTRISYGTSTWEAFRETDCREIDGVKYWWDMYSDELVKMGSSKPDNNLMNIEHSVAKSWWGGGTNDAYCDICHLNPSNSNANSRKSNYPMAEIGTQKWTNGVTTIGSPVSGQGGGASQVYEPCDEYKGDMARVFMYMFTVYDDISWTTNTAWMYDKSSDLLLKPWAYNMLLKWSAGDVVSQKERDRNDAIMRSAQNGRNPFIDLPDLAEYIWGSKKGQPFHLDGSVTPDTPVVPDEPADSEYEMIENDFEDGKLGGWTVANAAGNMNWYDKSYQDNHYATASAYKGTETGGPYETWLISPVVKYSEGDEALLSFRTQGAYYCADSRLEVYLLSDPDRLSDLSSMKKLDAGICTPNANGAKPVYCDWVESGEIRLPYLAPKSYVGFRFYSPRGGDGNSSTYCLDDIKIEVRRATTGVGDLYEDEAGDISFLVEVWGNNIIAPEGSRIFDLNGREVRGDALQTSVYIVVNPKFEKSVKILVK